MKLLWMCEWVKLKISVMFPAQHWTNSDNQLLSIDISIFTATTEINALD